MRLNEVLNINNFREHSLFPDFLEYWDNNVIDPDDAEEWVIYETFLTWLEDL